MVADQIGQPIRLGRRVVFHGTKDLKTGVVRALGPTFVRVHEDGMSRVVTKKPWECVVYGEAYEPAFKDLVA